MSALSSYHSTIKLQAIIRCMYACDGSACDVDRHATQLSVVDRIDLNTVYRPSRPPREGDIHSCFSKARGRHKGHVAKMQGSRRTWRRTFQCGELILGLHIAPSSPRKVITLCILGLDPHHPTRSLYTPEMCEARNLINARHPLYPVLIVVHPPLDTLFSTLQPTLPTYDGLNDPGPPPPHRSLL